MVYTTEMLLIMGNRGYFEILGHDNCHDRTLDGNWNQALFGSLHGHRSDVP